MLKDLSICKNTSGCHFINVTTTKGMETVQLDIPEILKSEKFTRELLNGLGSILSSMSCHLPTKAVK